MDVLYDAALEFFELAIYAWPVSLALFVLALVALFWRTPFRNPEARANLWWLAIPYLFPLVVAAVGVALQYGGPQHPNWVKPPEWRSNVLLSVLVFHAVAGVFIPALLGGVRLRIVALVLPSLWLSLSFAFAAAIAIEGVGP